MLKSSEAPSDASQSILPCQVCWSNCTLPITRGLSSSGSSGLLVRFLSFWGLGAGMLSLLKLPLTLHRAFSLVKFAGQTAHCHFQEVQLKWLSRAYLEVPLFLGAGGRHAETPCEAPSDASQGIVPCQVCWSNCTLPITLPGSQLKWLFRASREVPLFLGAGGRHAKSFEAPSDASQSILPCQVCWSKCTLPFPGGSAQVALQSLS